MKIKLQLNNGRTVIKNTKSYTLKCPRTANGEHKAVIEKNWKRKVTIIKPTEIILTIPEANMLDVLTRRSKIDTWFYIDDRDLHHMVIRDLENHNRILNTSNAILMVAEAITDINDYYLTAGQIRIWNNLINRILKSKGVR